MFSLAEPPPQRSFFTYVKALKNAKAPKINHLEEFTTLVKVTLR